MGATVALPFLDAMVPAGRVFAKTRGDRAYPAGLHRRGAWARRLQQPGRRSILFAPEQVGPNFTLVPDNPLSTLEAYRDYLTIISNTDVRMAEAFSAAGNRRRPLPVERGVPDPGAAEADPGLRHLGRHLDGPDVRPAFGQDTPLPSMQFCIENLDQAGGCTYNYSCAYTDSISWASPNEPLPMIRDPRVAFDMLFGAGALGQGPRRAA
jgi:hypothetical protein